MVRTTVFPEWLGWLGITVAILYLTGLIGKLIWAALATSQIAAFFFFLLFVLLTGINLLRNSRL